MSSRTVDLPHRPADVEPAGGRFDVARHEGVEARAIAWNLDVLRDLLEPGADRPAILDFGGGRAAARIAEAIPGARVLANDAGGREGLDAVHAARALDEIEYLPKTLDGLAAALKPRGVLCAFEPVLSLDADKLLSRLADDLEASEPTAIRRGRWYFFDYVQMLHDAGFADVRVYPYFLLDRSVAPSAIRRELILPFYPMPSRYVEQCRSPRKALYDMLAAFDDARTGVPFYAMVYASKERSLDALDRWFVNAEARTERLRRAGFAAPAKPVEEPTEPSSPSDTEAPPRTIHGRPTTPAYLENRARRDREIARGADTVRSYPSRISIDLTTKCNIACFMCHRLFWESKDRRHVFPYERWLQLEPWLAYADEIVFGQGGENLLHPRIKDILRDLQKYPQLFKVLMSNGMLLDDPELFDVVVSSIDRLGISIEGATKETFERIRKGADFDRIIRNVRAVQEWSRANGNAIEVIFHTIPMRENLEELPALVDLAHELGVPHIACQHLITISGMETVKAEQSIMGMPEAWNRVLAECRAKADEYGIVLDFPGPLEVHAKPATELAPADDGCGSGCGCASASDETETPDLKADCAEARHVYLDEDEKAIYVNPESKCHAPWGTFQIAANGEYYPCCYILAGTLNDEESPEAAWNGKLMRDVRRRVNLPDPKDWPRECRICQHRMK